MGVGGLKSQNFLKGGGGDKVSSIGEGRDGHFSIFNNGVQNV